MNRMSRERRAQVVSALIEGNSVRATCRMTGASKNTVTKLLVELGAACSEYQDRTLRDLRCKRIALDEIWAFCYAKQKNVPEDKRGEFGYGDVWTFTAICADSKLVPTWLVGPRDLASAVEFVGDLATRLRCRPEITTDGLKVYPEAIERAFGANVDYTMLQKLYRAAPEGQRRYSPPRCIGVWSERIQGRSIMATSSYVERQNLTMRMHMRRFTRLTNAFSKKVENLAHSVSLHFMHYNFCRAHRSLRTKRNNRITPAMAAGVADRQWSISDVLAPLETTERDAFQVWADSCGAN